MCASEKRSHDKPRKSECEPLRCTMSIQNSDLWMHQTRVALAKIAHVRAIMSESCRR